MSEFKNTNPTVNVQLVDAGQVEISTNLPAHTAIMLLSSAIESIAAEQLRLDKERDEAKEPVAVQ